MMRAVFQEGGNEESSLRDASTGRTKTTVAPTGRPLIVSSPEERQFTEGGHAAETVATASVRASNVTEVIHGSISARQEQREPCQRAQVTKKDAKNEAPAAEDT